MWSSVVHLYVVACLFPSLGILPFPLGSSAFLSYARCLLTLCPERTKDKGVLILRPAECI